MNEQTEQGSVHCQFLFVFPTDIVQRYQGRWQPSRLGLVQFQQALCIITPPHIKPDRTAADDTLFEEFDV